MPGQPLYPLVDRVLEGRLAELLGQWKRANLSTFQIALKLRDDHDISVSPDTVSRWLKEYAA